MENIAENLFESAEKVRILRLFMQNPKGLFSLDEIVKKSKVKRALCLSIVLKLLKISVIKKKIGYIRLGSKDDLRSKNLKTKKVPLYYTNQNFPLFSELRDLIVNSSVASRNKLVNKIKKLGNVKLAVISGIFIRNGLSRTDILIVGDKLAPKKLSEFIASIESELGRSIRYTVMDTKEFKYRLDMYDRFLRDIFEFPHEKLINRIGV